MAAFALPVNRNNFLYSSILYADAGNDNHHPRASVTELTALLRPETPKGKKTKTPAVNEQAKDPPWHFWTAQLIHYGLTSTKDKNAAKVRLLSALNENRLEVPGWIVRLEAEVKKEWEAENRKLKKAAKEGAMSKSSKIAKPAATPRSSPVKESTKNDPSKSTAAKTSATAPATPKSTTSKRKRDDTKPSNAVTPAKKAKPRLKKEQTAEAKMDTASGRSRVMATDLGQDDIVLSGTYEISSDYIEDFLLNPITDSPLRLVLFTEEATGFWWAKFHWAMFDGIMKMDPGPIYETITDSHTLGWRIRNEETGRLTFGRNCTGEIRFDGRRRTLEGVLHDVPGAGRIDFEGQRMPGPRRVGGLTKEWDRFVDEAYGRL